MFPDQRDLEENPIFLLILCLGILSIWILYILVLCMMLYTSVLLKDWEPLLSIIGGFLTLLTTIFIAWTGYEAYKVYREQAEISETTNLMTLWTEHNTIMARINDISISQPRHKYLIYFELIMYLERICNMYYELWSDNEKLQKRFHALFDGTIGHTMKEHYYPTMLYLFIFRNRNYDDYGITKIERYYKELQTRNKAYKGYYISIDKKELDETYKKDTAYLLLELRDYQNGTQDKNQNE